MNSLTRRQAIGALGALALPWENLFAQPAAPALAVPGALPGPPQSPDLANVHAIIEGIARERPLRLSFLDPQWRELDAWKKAARPELRRCLSYEPKPVPLGAEVVRKEPREGFTLEVIKIRATPTYEIPARVLVPAKRSGRLPAVVGIHCHSGRYTWGQQKLISYPDDSAALIEMRGRNYERPWAEALARRGYLVIVIDGFYFGERRLRVEELQPDRVIADARENFNLARRAAPDSAEWHQAINRVCSAYEHLTAKNIFSAGATWPGIHVWDDRRTIDYLLSRPDVDPNRIGAAGLSIGGLRTAHLIGADPRIKAAVVTGWMTEFAQQHRNHLRSHTWMIYIPGLYSSMDFPDIASLHAPGALLVQQCSRDQLYPLEAMQGAVRRLTQVYAKAGIPERFRGTFYDKPHVFHPDMQEEAFAWFDRWL